MSSSWPGITCCCLNNFASWVCCVKRTYDQVCLTGHQEEDCGPITYTTEIFNNQVTTCDQTCSATELECMCQCYNDNPECSPSYTLCFKRNYTDQITGQQADPCDPSSWLPPCAGGYGGGGQGGAEGLDCSSGIGQYMQVPCTQWHISGQVTYNPSEPCVELCASSSTSFGSGEYGGFGCSSGSGTFGGGDSSQGISDEYTSCEAVWTDEPCVPGPYTAYVLEGFVRPDAWVPPEDYECDDGCEPKPPKCINWGCGSCGPLPDGCGKGEGPPPDPDDPPPDPDDPPPDPDDPPEDPCPPQEECPPAQCCLPPPTVHCCCTTFINGVDGCLCLADHTYRVCSETASSEQCEVQDTFGSDNPPQVGDTQCWVVESCADCLNPPPPGSNPCMGVLTYAVCSASCCPCGMHSGCGCPGSGCGVDYPPESGCNYVGQNFPGCHAGWPCCHSYSSYCEIGCPADTVGWRIICGCECDCPPEVNLCAPGKWVRRRGVCSELADASTAPAFNPNYVSPETEQARLDLLKHLELFGYGTSYITSIQL